MRGNARFNNVFWGARRWHWSLARTVKIFFGELLRRIFFNYVPLSIFDIYWREENGGYSTGQTQGKAEENSWEPDVRSHQICSKCKYLFHGLICKSRVLSLKGISSRISVFICSCYQWGNHKITKLSFSRDKVFFNTVAPFCL